MPQEVARSSPADDFGPVPGRSPDTPEGTPSYEARTAAEAVVTRLLLRYGLTAHVRSDLCRSRMAKDRIDSLVALVIRPDPAAAAAAVDALCDGGTSLDVVLHDLLIGAARRLEEMWRGDLCTSIDLTIGLCNLRLLVSRLMPRVGEPIEVRRRVGHATILSVPGDRASLDPLVHQVYLSEAGWQVEGIEGLEESAIVGWFARTSSDLALISVVQAGQVDRLPRLIETILSASRNPGLRLLILAGAYQGAIQPLLALDADGIVRDPLETLWEAQWCRPAVHRGDAAQTPVATSPDRSSATTPH